MLGEGECSKHWFKDDCHGKLESVFNIDFDDIVDPFWFENHKEKSKMLCLETLSFKCYFRIGGKDNTLILHALDYEEAFDLVYWIDNREIYVSRHQAVRYIVDTYMTLILS